jgi:hypothetical protein
MMLICWLKHANQAMVMASMVASTWLGDHEGRPPTPLIRRVKLSKYGTLTKYIRIVTY